MSRRTTTIEADLQANLKALREQLGDSGDLRIHKMGGQPEAAVVYLAGSVDEQAIGRLILEPLGQGSEAAPWVAGARTSDRWPDALAIMFGGSALLLTDGAPGARVLPVRATAGRQVEEPPSSPVVRGPRKGFVENLYTNLGLIRRRLPDAGLRVSMVTVGRRTQTQVAVLHVAGLAPDSLVQKVQARLHRIEVDGVIESGSIESFLEDEKRFWRMRSTPCFRPCATPNGSTWWSPTCWRAV